MIDAGIHEGDFVIIERTRTPTGGDTVLALVDNALTLKILTEDAHGRFCKRPTQRMRRSGRRLHWTFRASRSACFAVPSLLPNPDEHRYPTNGAPSSRDVAGRNIRRACLFA